MSDGRTHWEGCWRDHHDCAVAEVERLREERDSQQRLCLREMEKAERLRNALLDARSYFDRVPKSLGYWVDVIPDIDRALRETRDAAPTEAIPAGPDTPPSPAPPPSAG